MTLTKRLFVPHSEISLSYQHNLLIREKMYFTNMMLIFVP